MKTAIRIFAMTIALTGLSTSSFSITKPAAQAVANHPAPFASTSGMSALPIPMCGPYICPPRTSPSVTIH